MTDQVLPTRKPVIGISGSSAESKSVAAMIAQVSASGATPVFFGNHATRNADADLARVDAIIVMGNNGDIDPAKYGKAKHEKTNVETDLARAAYEERIIQLALEKKVPLLGVCGGMQRINVLGGGTLEQHVPDRVHNDSHAQGDVPPFIPVQYIQIQPGSTLARISGSQQGLYAPTHDAPAPDLVMENSMHHQAVDKIRPDFRVAARSSDGTVEAIEPVPGSRHADQFILGVQWHPEFGASPLSPKLMQAITQAAKSYAQEVPHEVFTERQAVQESALSSAPQIEKATSPAAKEWQNYIAARRSGQGIASGGIAF